MRGAQGDVGDAKGTKYPCRECWYHVLMVGDPLFELPDGEDIDEYISINEFKSSRNSSMVALLILGVLAATSIGSIVVLSMSTLWLESAAVIPDVLSSIALISVGAVAGVLGSRGKE
jgi:hypothetical protein